MNNKFIAKVVGSNLEIKANETAFIKGKPMQVSLEDYEDFLLGLRANIMEGKIRIIRTNFEVKSVTSSDLNTEKLRFRTLKNIAEAGEPKTLASISEELNAKQTQLTGSLLFYQNLGFIKRIKEGRASLYSITPLGMRKYLTTDEK